ncbi:MAG: Amylo-alpha-16-glucosidase [Candidatus Moranbacteria bacterium GW2011_GWC2_37_8]|nr:MAG: Amylo-alpha-16-glucosidase [Candidatus Moranbacteria bacterium GW2011_GWC2_37_8]KKQ62312.1 MAG: Amylo-alpha-16-glucosidase [Parcubacteria group bacterium GW2011_GWC1_38_22]
MNKLDKQETNITYDPDYFYNLGMQTIQALEVPGGVLASSAEEIYGCIFGRDSLISALKLLKSHDYESNPYYLYLTRKILEGLLELQGKEINIESGEEPGKCIHEFRATAHERLTKTGTPPWYMYSDGTMRNFDSIDSTPLLLIALYRYFQKSSDTDFIKEKEKNINLALDWILNFGDKNGDGFIDYEKHPERKAGGLDVQSWMDSAESVFHEDDIAVVFPISPVEAQAYSYLALKLWSKYFSEHTKKRAEILSQKAKHLKQEFNKRFVFGQPEYPIFAHAIDNNGKALVSKRSSIGHILWACLNEKDDGKKDCILDKQFIEPLIKNILQPDIFEPTAGIRTLSKESRVFDPISYHNGSIWPHDNSLIAEGMQNFGFKKEAHLVRHAIFSAYTHFQTPIELFAFHEGNYLEYKSQSGQIACREQAWSAASMIADALALKHE